MKQYSEEIQLADRFFIFFLFIAWG